MCVDLLCQAMQWKAASKRGVALKKRQHVDIDGWMQTQTTVQLLPSPMGSSSSVTMGITRSVLPIKKASFAANMSSAVIGRCWMSLTMTSFGERSRSCDAYAFEVSSIRLAVRHKQDQEIGKAGCAFLY